MKLVLNWGEMQIYVGTFKLFNVTIVLNKVTLFFLGCLKLGVTILSGAY